MPMDKCHQSVRKKYKYCHLCWSAVVLLTGAISTAVRLRRITYVEKIYDLGIFNGGNLFPSPTFFTSTQIDCDNS
jgi:hypothetical protein